MEDTCTDMPSLPEVIPGITVHTEAAEVGLLIHQVLDNTFGKTARSLGEEVCLGRAVASKSLPRPV